MTSVWHHAALLDHPVDRLALAAPPAFAGKLDAVTQAAKTYIAKKETGGSGHGNLASGGNSKAGKVVDEGKKLLGK